jgi:hypothetical protein
MRQRLGHVDPHLSEGPPCEAGLAEAVPNEPVNGLASKTAQKRLKIPAEQGLDRPQLKAILAV